MHQSPTTSRSSRSGAALHADPQPTTTNVGGHRFTPLPPHHHQHQYHHVEEEEEHRVNSCGDSVPLLVSALRSAIVSSLLTSVNTNAVFMAERLFEVEPSYRNLHTLAHCYSRGGGGEGGATACRLLQGYYPFFEVHVTRPASAGAASGARSLQRPGNADEEATIGGADGATPHHHQHQQHSSPRHARRGPLASPPSAALHATDASLSPAHGSGNVCGLGGSLSITHAPVDLAARWDCQYLLGVCCAQTGRYTEGTKVLEELARVAVRLEAEGIVVATTTPTTTSTVHGNRSNSNGDNINRNDISGSDVEVQLAHDREQQQQLLLLGSVSAGCPRFYRERLGEVHHWLGLCARRLRLDTAADHFRRATTENPILFAAFEAHVQSAWKPTEESCGIAVYDDAAPFVFAADAGNADEEKQREEVEEEGSPHAQRHRSEHPTATAAAASGALATARRSQSRRHRRGRDRLRSFLRPYARASFALHTFRCRDAQAALADDQFTVPAADGIAGGGRTTATDTAPSSSSSSSRHTTTSSSSSSVVAITSTVASPWRLAGRALALFNHGDMPGCAAAYAAYLSTSPWRLDEPGLVCYSTALWQLRDGGSLGALAQRLTEETPLSPITLCVVANTYSLAKESRDAIAMLDRAIQIDGGDGGSSGGGVSVLSGGGGRGIAYAHALRGYELLALGMGKEARDAFNRAINADHNLYTAYAGLGQLCVTEERIDNARHYFKQAIGLNPQPTIMNRYAATYHRRGATHADLVIALGIYTEAVRHNSANISARHQRADVLLTLGRVEEAAAELTAMIRGYPEEAMLHATLARCCEAQGDTRRAVVAYHRAMALDPRREGFVRACIERLSAEAAGEAGDASGLA